MLVHTCGLQPHPLPFGQLSDGGPTEIRTQIISLLRRARLPITPSARNYPSRYRNRKMVWVAGFEPATSPLRTENSDQSELHPDGFGRGRMTFMDRV